MIKQLKNILCREDTFVRILDVEYGNGPVAVFEYAFGMYTGRDYETHFNIDRPSLLTRITNLKMPKNYGKTPWSLVQENAALAAMNG